MRNGWLVLVLLAGSCAPCVAAPVISLTGTLDATDANDVFLFQLQVSAPGDVTIQSWGYGGGVNGSGASIAEGGFDGYLSLFSGIGPDAEFLASDDDGGCPPAGGLLCGDPRLTLHGLAPGLYTLALSVFLNLSFAENLGSGTLGDGFIGLGSYYDWRTDTDRTSAFALDIEGAEPYVAPIPEPAIAVLLGAGGLVWRVAGRRRPSRDE